MLRGGDTAVPPSVSAHVDSGERALDGHGCCASRVAASPEATSARFEYASRRKLRLAPRRILRISVAAARQVHRPAFGARTLPAAWVQREDAVCPAGDLRGVTCSLLAPELPPAARLTRRSIGRELHPRCSHSRRGQTKPSNLRSSQAMRSRERPISARFEMGRDTAVPRVGAIGRWHATLETAAEAVAHDRCRATLFLVLAASTSARLSPKSRGPFRGVRRLETTSQVR